MRDAPSTAALEFLTRATARTASLGVLAFAFGCAGDELPDSPVEGSGATLIEAAVDEEALAESPLDAAIAAAVLAQLAADPAVDATLFDASVSEGVVTLTSRATDAASWAHARDLAALVDGVSQVQMATAQPAADGSAVGSAPALRDLTEAFGDAAAFGTPPAEPLEVAAEGEGSGSAIAHAASGDRPRTYVVQPGDSLSVIAQRTMGDGLAWQRIYELNRSVIGANPQALQAGMELRIPQD